MINFELSANLCHRIVVEIVSIIRNYGFQLSISIYNVLFDKMGNNNLRHTREGSSFDQYSKVVDDHKDETVSIQSFG